jgi:hypothetical protein
MVTATFFCLGLAVCIFAGLVCYALAKSVKAASASQVNQVSPSEMASWNRLKPALVELHSRYETKETAKERALRSWAGTLVICAGLCMIGILLEARYNSFITVKNICSGLVGEQRVVPQSMPKFTPGQVQNKPASQTTTR